jgi:chemotaxis family two-component system response regulator Rcp1
VDPATAPAPIEILLVEDNLGDIRLTKEALKDSKILNILNVVRNGEQALDYLRKSNEYTDAVRPDLILLDLNLPKKNGQEVLAEIKTDPDLKRIPVVILTTSKAELDILQSYNLHANCYIIKPVNFEDFTTVIRSIENFWFTVVKLPS